MKKLVDRAALRVFWFASLAVLGTSLSAHAEKADREKPVFLEADRVVVDDAKKVSTYTGNVILSQGTLRITGNKLVVTQDAEGFEHGTVYGNPASFRQKREGYDEYIEGYGQRIEYDAKADKLELFTQARMKRNNDEVRGNYISYDAKTEIFNVMGGPKEAESGGRVRAVIQPKPKTDAGSAPATPAPSKQPAN